MIEAKDLHLSKQVLHFFPEAEGEESVHRIALLKACDYAGMIRCKPIGEIARHHAIDAQDAAYHFFYNAHATVQQLKLAVAYCRHLAQAAFIAEHIDPEVWQ
ncbi:hypothetical protein ACI5KX_13950 [Erythrobacter sp. GH1-10]|uniref:hypothetical protein n=1 Tax=Erythrobacter sp. GH1-10 TaxID=3349334 RepID=UPI003877D236